MGTDSFDSRLETVFKESSGIILACDVTTLPELRSLVSIQTERQGIVGIKIGFMLALKFGLPSVVAEIRNVSSLPIIYDHQKAGTDIPAMGASFAECCDEAGVDAAIIFAHAGPATLRAFVEALSKTRVTPIVGAAMTHPHFLISEGGYISDDIAEQAYNLALSLDIDWFVAPGTKPELIRRLAALAHQNERAAVMMPGIGTQQGDINLAFEAAGSMRKYAIIGSAIYKAQDPLAAATCFHNQILALK